MTKIKLCGLSRPCDIETANKLMPDYIGFVFAPKSSRYVSYEKAAELKELLSPNIKAVGVFVNEPIEQVAKLLANGVIDIAQLHGDETDEYIKELKALSKKPVIKALRIKSEMDVITAEKSTADYVLLDSGAGGGETFDWNIIKDIKRPYFLAGGLNPDNVTEALSTLRPYAVDVSSGVETEGVKDRTKMAAFVAAVRRDENI